MLSQTGRGWSTGRLTRAAASSRLEARAPRSRTLTTPAPQAAEGLHRHAGAAGRDHGGLLAHAVGEQLDHRGDADQAAGDGPGRRGPRGAGGGPAGPQTGLTTPAPPPQEKCHQYWPAERSARYQYFVVDPMAEYNMPQYILREFKVTDARVSVARGRLARLGHPPGGLDSSS